MSWLTPSVAMTTQTAGAGGSGLGGVFKRVVSGGSIFMTAYTAQGGEGVVAFAAKMPGHIKPITVSADREYVVSRHGFMAATPDVTLNLAVQQKLGVGIFSGNGFVLQRIAGEGTAWIELSGELVEYDLAPGEVMMAHPGHVGLLKRQLILKLREYRASRTCCLVRTRYFSPSSLAQERFIFKPSHFPAWHMRLPHTFLKVKVRDQPESILVALKSIRSFVKA